MLRPSLLLKISILLITTLLAACSNNVLRMTKFTPNEEIGEFQSFTITFNKEIAPTGKTDEWLKADYLNFEPAISGRYKWVDGKTLIFSPSTSLQQGQTYKANFNKTALLATSKTPDMSARFNEISFKTPDFSVLKAEIFYDPIPHAEYKLAVVANIHFNYAVKPEELREHLQVFKGKEEIKNYTFEENEAAEVVAVNFGEVAQTPQEQAFKIVVKKGLNSVLKKTPLKDDRSFSVELPPIQRLAITEAVAAMTEDGYEIIVTASQQIDPEKAAKYIEVVPALGNQTIETSDNVMTIKGNIKPEGEVKLKIAKGLPGLYGGVLENEYTEYLTADDVEPIMRFSDRKGIYLMRGGMENLKIETVNVPEVEVEIQEVFQNNMLFFFANNYSYDSYRYRAAYGFEENLDFETGDYGKSIYTEEIKFGGAKNEFQYATINLHKAINQRFKGIYVVKITSNDDYYVRDAKIISFSDIGLIAKYSGTDLMVFANSIKTTQSLAGVNVNLISSNNQILATAVTDAQGIANFPNVKEKVKDFTPRLISAEMGDDFNFIDLDATEIETSRYDVGGKMVSSDFYDTYIYSDRNIYRPGETANLSAIVRDAAFGIVKDLPVVAKIISPTGKVFNTYQKTLNEQGSFELQVELPEFAQTGQYVMEVRTGDDKLMDSYRFNVEEFAPDKIRVKLDAPETAALGQEVAININAEYLFGEPAAGQKYESDIILNHQSFESKKFKDYNFSKHTFTNTSTNNESSEGTLDSKGDAVLKYTVPKDLESGGYMEGAAYVSVFDPTGRTVNRLTRFNIYPKDYFVGIKQKGYYFNTNEAINLQVVAVNPEDKAIPNFEASVTLIRFEWKTVLEKNSEGKFSYRSAQKEVVEKQEDISIKSAGQNLSFKTDKSGRYQVRIAKKGETAYVFEDFYVYSYGSSNASSFEIDKEGRIDITFDKESYQPGETAKVLFVTPFTGKMLVTVERDKIYKHFYVEVTKSSTELSFPIEEAYLPNVYISATLFKPHGLEEQGIPLLVGHGYAALMVEKPATKLPVNISAPEKIRPNTKQTVTIKTTPGKEIFVTLAAVDEGILQVKHFKTPDPHEYMYSKRKLSVESYDLYELLLPEHKAISSAAGGDDYASGKRQNPIRSKRFKLVSIWSGIKKTNANGEVQVTLEIPQYNGELRLMAVAYEGARFGSGEKAMKVSDDVILMPAIPRALTMGDSLSMPVAVMNTTEKAGNVNVSIEVEGPLRVTGAKTQTVSVEGNGNKNVYFGIASTGEVGVAKIRLTTTGLGTTKDETEIAVRPASSFVVESDGTDISAGENKTLSIPSDYVQGTQNTRLTVSVFPALKYSEKLRFLIGYPYGCIEQTTSKLFPQLYFNELAQVAAPDLIGKGTTSAYFVKEGIHKIQNMMDYDGRFAYWSGGSEYNWWSSVYATHFLVEAKKAGFEVDNYTMERALRNLGKQANEKPTEDYVTFLSTGRSIRQIAPKSAIYSLYVLSLAGKPDISLMNYYRARPELLTGDTKYMLAGSFALAKNWAAYNEIIPKTFEAELTERNSYNFDSDIRSNAMMLNVLLDVDPTNDKVRVITNYLAKQANNCFSTQDNAWFFLALGKAAGKKADSKVNLEVQANGKTIHTFNKANETFVSNDLNGKTLTIKATGNGTTYINWNTEGTKKAATVKDEDKEVKVRRTYFDRKGVEIKGNNFKQGDLIVCRITLVGGERAANYLAISDLVPSAFDIENPRLDLSAELKWIEKAGGSFKPQFVDIRDDRVLLFTDIAAKETKTYYYMMRVVNQGRFQLPAIGAEAMYDPNVHSYNGAKVINVM